jgi:hypothetical protein
MPALVDHQKLTELETAAIERALGEKGVEVSALQGTLSSLRVIAREHTGFGFFTKFAIDPAAQVEGLDQARLAKRPPAIFAFHPAINGVADFLVWIKDGQIVCLEASSTSTWPSDDSLSAFTFEAN